MKNPIGFNFFRRWSQIFLVIFLIINFLVGCGLPWQGQTERVTKEADIAVEPEMEETATPEPRDDIPPALIESTPLPESQIGLNEAISLYFNQPMDTASVEAAVRFEPSTSGSFSWEDEQMMTFTPDQALTPGSRLNLLISTNAQAANRLPLQDPIEVTYQVADLLEWVQSVPANDAMDIDPASTIFVVFNQPVVSLGAEADAPAAFTLSPEVDGEGEWINTSTYLFKPEISMAGGTTYTIQLKENLTAVSGSHFNPSQAVDIQFTTTQPMLLNLLPLSEERLSLNGPIELQFNIRMDPESIEKHFRLTNLDGQDVEGEFEWDDQFRTFSFWPNETLARDTTYIIQLDAGAESFGGLPIPGSTETTRRTFPEFAMRRGSAPKFESYYQQFGVYSMVFTTPIDKEIFKNHVLVSPEVNMESQYLLEDGTMLNLSGYFAPETEYTVTISDELKDAWGGTLELPLTLTFVTPPAQPSLNIITGATEYNLVFVPASQSEIVLQATNINRVDLEISPISVDDLITLLNPDNYDYRQIFLPETLEKSFVNLELTRNKNEMVQIPLSYQGDPLSPGVYFLGVSSPDLEEQENNYNQRLFIIVSENNVVLKISPEEALVWGTRLEDYSPLSDTPVTVYTSDGAVLAEGKTDSKGLFKGTFERSEASYYNFYTLLGEPGRENFAFSISNWTQYTNLYDQSIRFESLPAETKAYIYTDRPLYRPGDTVHFKALIYNQENGQPVAPGLESITVNAYGDVGLSGMMENLYSNEHNLSEYGTLNGSFTLSENAAPGFYRIEMAIGEEVLENFYFEVAAYRKPDIELNVDLEEENLLVGEILNAVIQADYYFGLPVSDQPFSWSLYQDDAHFDLPGYQVGPIDAGWMLPRFYDETTPLGKTIASGESRTGLTGRSSLEFTPEDLPREDSAQGNPKEINLEVTITDESGFPVSYRDSATIHPENHYIGIKPESYYASVEEEIQFGILTVDWEKVAVGDLPLEASFEAIEWRIEETYEIEMPYRYIPETSFIGSASPVTDAEGQARVSFTPPEPGTYRLTVESGDAISQVLIWVTGSGSAVWPRQVQNQINLTPDAEGYEPGQIAQVFIPNPFPEGAKALVSVERGLVMETQILDLSGTGTVFSLPITEKAIPNIYLSVLLLGKTEEARPDFRQGILKLPVSPQSKTLDVTLMLDPTITEPGESVSGRLMISDAEGNPVQGEFSIAVVDKALLALVEPTQSTLVEVLYGEQPLSVRSSLSLKTYASQLALNPLDLGRGGGGAGELQTQLREDFPDTAFWQAEIITGRDGTAQVNIPLPDSMTTWVVSVRGLSTDYLVGQTEAEILVQKDLMIRPITPRFLVDGDEVEMAAMVHNNTTQSLEVDVSLSGTGYTLLDQSPETQSILVEAGGRAWVTWMGLVESVDSVALEFQAVSGHLIDASVPVWGDLTVRRYTVPYTFSTAGQLAEEGQRLELVSLPLSSDPKAGKLSLALTPSLTATVIESLEALETSAFSNTITILSRLMANLHAYSALSELGVDSPQLETNLNEVIDEGIKSLLESQNFDGGWTWWRQIDVDTSSDPFLSAYVVLGLTEAVQEDIEIPDHVLTRAVEFLRYQLSEPGEIGTSWGLDKLAFQVYALQDSDLALNGYTQGLYSRRSELSPWALGLLALTINNQQGSLEQVGTLLADLESRAVRSGTGVHWESDQGSWLLPGSPIFNTAISVFTLAQLDPASSSLAPALIYLLNHREPNGLWESTFDSAWCLKAITQSLQGTGDYQAEYDFQASLNDAPLAQGSVSGIAPLNSVMASIPIEELYPDTPNMLMIERGPGAGTLHYRLDLQTYQNPSEASAINRGIIVQRDYYLAETGCPGDENCTPIDSLSSDPNDPSQMITTAITLNVSQDMYHFMLEDNIPSGTEVLDPALLTTQTLPVDALLEYDPLEPFKNGWGWWYFNDPQIFDDHIAWYAEFLPAGTYLLTYELLPTHRGTFQVLPARAWQYFYPEVQGTSSGTIFSID